MKPLAIDLFCGLGGWTDGLLAEGYEVVGFDIERHQYGDQKYPAQLVLQDVLTIHGSQFRNAALIVCSPPCQEFSYMAMPWKLAKAKAAAIRADKSGVMLANLTRLFDACFRIQREACEAAGRYIPMVVENVKGAQPWVGRAEANFGSFYLWGDVAMVGNRVVCGREFGNYTKPMRAERKNGEIGGSWFPQGNGAAVEGNHGRDGMKFNPDGTAHPQGSWFAIADSKNRGAAQKVPGFNFHEHEKTGKSGRSFPSAAVEGVKGAGGGWHGDYKEQKASGRGAPTRQTSSHSSARKAASAQIAKIPFALSSYVARSYKPRIEATA